MCTFKCIIFVVEVLESMCTFKCIIFVVEVLESMNKILQKYFLDNPVSRSVAILKLSTKFVKKQTSKKSIFKVGSSESINKIAGKKPTKKFPF